MCAVTQSQTIGTLDTTLRFTGQRLDISLRKEGNHMRIIYSLIFLFIFLLGIFWGIKAYGRSKAIFWSTEWRFRAAIVDSALFGLSLSLVFFGGVYLFASIADKAYPLEIPLLLKSFAVFLIPGLLVFLGSLLQYFIFGLYRDRLMKFILNKRNVTAQA